MDLKPAFLQLRQRFEAGRALAFGYSFGYSFVEVLAAYSHSAQASELHLCLQDAASRRPKRRPVTKQAWSLSDRLTEAQRLAIVDAYRSGAPAARLAATHDLSLSSLKRILRSAKATRSTSDPNDAGQNTDSPGDRADRPEGKETSSVKG
jgi:hypothetical protein